MRNKHILLNLCGIVLAIAIAFGGAFALRGRLDAERRELLSGGGKVEIPARTDQTVSQSFGVVDVELKETVLTKEELRQAVLCMEEASEKYAHEPMRGQLSMTEAIQSGMAWIADFFLPRLDREAAVPEECRLNCYLWAGGAGEAGDEAPDPMLGYWEVSFSAQELDAVLLLNAVTGQVLQARIALPYAGEERPDEDSLAQLLEDYADSFGIETSFLISAAWDGEAETPAYGAGDQKGEGRETGSRGAGSQGTGNQRTESRGGGVHLAEGRGTADSAAAGKESWGFRQRLENDQISVCLEAGDAVSAQARLSDSGEALHFVLYLETRH